MERHPAVWDRLLGQVTGLCPCLSDRRAAAICGAQPGGADRGLSALALDPCTGRDRPNIGWHRSILASIRRTVCVLGGCEWSDPATVSPLAPNTIDQPPYQAMRAFRRPIVTTHLYAFYALAVIIVLHLIAVVLTELHEGGSIISAMFTGTKLLNRPPEDR